MIRIMLGLVVCSAVAMGDTLVLNDGRRVEGDVRPEGTNWIVTDAAGKEVHVLASDVKSIEPGKRSSDAENARQRLVFIRRYADTQADTAAVISQYEKFLQQFPDSAQAADAQADLATWRQRQDQHMTRIGGRWLMPAEVAAWDEKATALIEQGRSLVRDGRLKDASQVLDGVLADDPTNAGALYLKGIVLYRQEQLPASRKCFEGVLAVFPDHGASMNNLGVIFWRLKQEAAAITMLDRAMAASPVNQRILDNVAEILSVQLRDVSSQNAARSASRRYAEQEPQLEQDLAANGWYRWGSTWVNKDQYAQLREQQQQINAQLDQLAKDYDAAEATIRQINDDIDSSQRTIQRIEADSVGRDAEGNLVRLPYPNIYYDLTRGIDRLTSRRRTEIDRLASLKQQAESVKAKLAVPPYSGQLRFIEQDSVPLMVRSAGRGASAPAVAPAPAATRR